MKKMSEKKEWTNGTGRTNRKSGEMLNTRARGDQNSGKSGKRTLSVRILNPAAGVSIWTCRMRSS